MRQNKKHLLKPALALCLSAAMIASINMAASAAPSSDELTQTTSGLETEINDLNRELSDLTYELENASAQIEDLAAQIETAKLDLASAELNVDHQYEAMKDRIKFMYEGGNSSLLHVLLSSESMGDFLNNAEYITVISEYDRSMLDNLRLICYDVEKKQEDLKSQQDELAALQQDLESRQQELHSRISSASGELAEYQAALERAKAAEEASKTAQNNQVSGSLPPASSSGSGSSNTNNGSSIDASVSDIALFAAILQCEAGASNYDGLLAVATVIMNRLESPSYPNTLRGVIYQSGQFSPTWNGSLDRVLTNGASNTAYAVAKAALAGARHSAVLNCYSFRAASSGASGVNIGGNVFF